MENETPTGPGIGHNLPKRKVAKTTPRTCPECTLVFQATKDARFCQAKCKDAFHNRSMKRGKVALPLLLAWRGGKGKKGDNAASYAFSQLCSLADRWNADDKAAGRMPAGDFIAPKMRDGWRACDLA